MLIIPYNRDFDQAGFGTSFSGFSSEYNLTKEDDENLKSVKKLRIEEN